MNIQEYVSLRELNTLAIPAEARYFAKVINFDELLKAVAFSEEHKLPRLVLGGGSNIVLSEDFPGLVIHLCLKGIDVTADAESSVMLRVAAGENWDELVAYSLKQGWFGLENLSAIPGSVGAAPIQNIGAYGVELSHVLVSVRGLDIASAAVRTLSKKECKLGYRDSIFKGELKDRFIITEVVLKLSRQPEINLSYPVLASEFEGQAAPTPQNVSDAVRRIRGSKLPAPSAIPNVGSFFKNPVVKSRQHKKLQSEYPDMPSWKTKGGYKLAAGWLVDQAGWKGFQGEGDEQGLGVYQEQALVLINPGSLSGRKVLALADRIRKSVEQKFNVSLEIEPRVY